MVSTSKMMSTSLQRSPQMNLVNGADLTSPFATFQFFSCFISLRFVPVLFYFILFFCTIEKTHWPIDQKKILRMSPSNTILISFSIKPETQDR